MSTHPYTEDQLVEQPAIGLFAALGWIVAGPPHDAGLVGEPRDAGLLGRETKGEVVLGARLRAALERLNPVLPPEAITAAVDELTRDRSAMSLEAANREVYLLLKEGTGLPRAYGKPLYEQKCSALFEHIYEAYPERDAGVYSAG
jgi:type I restriction enzyme R subunit